MTTLAEMTPEQRADCVGMWCETTYGMQYGMRIFAGEGFDEFMRRGTVAKMIRPIEEGFGYVPFNEVTPRPDLPRACQPDGSPVDMDVESGIVRSHPRGGVIGSYESPDYVDKPEGTVMRRFVGEWEEA